SSSRGGTAGRGATAKATLKRAFEERKKLQRWLDELAIASGQPFPMKRVVELPMTPEQEAVAMDTGTPGQRTIAKKQRRFLVVPKPYYPTLEDIKDAMHWLTERGFGKAPKTVPIQADKTTGFTMVFRRWPPGTDPESLGDHVTDGKKAPPV